MWSPYTPRTDVAVSLACGRAMVVSAAVTLYALCHKCLEHKSDGSDVEPDSEMSDRDRPDPLSVWLDAPTCSNVTDQLEALTIITDATHRCSHRCPTQLHSPSPIHSELQCAASYH
ncbi:uncharacterized protein LOC120356508 [Nilaparvata lugens]|uniref:uncharacterized protein LOC120356508 n=1 Tax=Nilaparvata lugens TaxID=108931 RepID=UPI00193CFA96|nr:uncharacterized protein LOC120356508 [Nilaparvata lugens]